MSVKNKAVRTFLTVITIIAAALNLYLLAAIITSSILGFTVLTVSIFAEVPKILSDLFWLLFIIVSLVVWVILAIIVIVKRQKQKKLAKQLKTAPKAEEKPKI